MLGYLNDPKATDDALKLHSDRKIWVHTGDYGYMDDEGYFHFMQRMKRIIKVSGIPVFPSQIEDVISSVENVREVSVIGIPHPYKMQVIKAYVALANPDVSSDIMKDEILKACEKKLIKHAIPAQIEFIESLPRTKVGKVDTMALEKMNIAL
jgi:long-chain acyl-CoA synthetase